LKANQQAFGNWVKKLLKQCGLTQVALSKEVNIETSGVSRYLRGQRKMPPLFLARTLLYLRRQYAFERPVEVMDGMALLGMTPEAVFSLIEGVFDETDPESQRFLDWLRDWDQPRVGHQVREVQEPQIRCSYPVFRDYIYDFTKTVEDATRWFVGRQFVFGVVEEFIQHHSCGYLRIIADAGLGKTAIAAKLTDHQVLAHFFDERGGVTSPEDCLNSLGAQLIIRYGLSHADLPAGSGRNSAFLSELLEEAVQNLSGSQRIVIIIDGLDEADSVPPGHNWLHLPARLPERVYVVLTHRTGDYPLYLDAGVPYDELVITWDDPHQMADVESYLWQAVGREDIRQALEKASPPISVEHFVTNLVEASEGNFMYLHFVLEDIAQGEADHTPLQIEELPIGLQGYYARFWAQMEQAVKGDEWWQLHLPVIELLAVAGEPVTAEWLADYIVEGNAAKVRKQVLGRWERFLGRGNPIENAMTWRIIHRSFADFLEKRDEVNLVEAHGRVANRYLSNPSLWKEYEGYAFRNQSAHLMAAGMMEELGALVEKREWYWGQRIYDLTLNAYFRDVKRSIAAAEEMGKDGLPRVIAWSILIGTLRDRASVMPIEALEALVLLGQEETALKYVEMVPGHLRRVMARCRIGVMLHRKGKGHQSHELLRSVQQIGQGIKDDEQRAMVWLELAKAWQRVGEEEYAGELLDRVESIAEAMLDIGARMRVLGSLVEATTQDADRHRSASHQMQVATTLAAERVATLGRVRDWGALARGWAVLDDGEKVQDAFREIMRTIEKGKDVEVRMRDFEHLVSVWAQVGSLAERLTPNLENLALELASQLEDCRPINLLVYALAKSGDVREAKNFVDEMVAHWFDDESWLKGIVALVEAEEYARVEELLNWERERRPLLYCIAWVEMTATQLERKAGELDGDMLRGAVRTVESVSVQDELDIAPRLQEVWHTVWGRLARALAEDGNVEDAEYALNKSLRAVPKIGSWEFSHLSRRDLIGERDAERTRELREEPEAGLFCRLLAAFWRFVKREATEPISGEIEVFQDLSMPPSVDLPGPVAELVRVGALDHAWDVAEATRDELWEWEEDYVRALVEIGRAFAKRCQLGDSQTVTWMHERLRVARQQNGARVFDCLAVFFPVLDKMGLDESTWECIEATVSLLL